MIKEEDYNFQFNSKACEICEAQCCSGESGNIFFTKNEMFEISENLNISTKKFLSDFCRKNGYRYSIKEMQQNGKYSCIFLSGNRCDIYDVRPNQCKTFPFWNEFKNGKNMEYLKNECIGVENIPKI